ncbi:MAG TPA: hypothetical protein VKW76_09635 [Candidatus Binatia bacterium]|nr:hypothetical protein [Candidatus Binatia bacterium]
MGYTLRRGRLVAAVVLAAVAAVPRAPRAQDDVRRELEEMKKQLRALQQQIERQQAIIQRLTAGQQQAAPAAAPASPPPAATTATAEDEERLRRQVTEQVLRRIQPSLAAANKTFPAQFNPAIGFVIDSVGSYSSKERSNFEFRSGEIGISASVDPFARGYAIINGTQTGIDVEEAAIVTTSLPWNLTVKGGRFFADFGRLSKFHDHDLPFVNRPIALDRYVDGESQADGVEVNWLAPLRQYLTLTAGAYNKMGADNTRVDNTVPRDFSKNTYLGRAATFFNLSDANSLDLGASLAYTPKVEEDGGAHRALSGLDLTYRYVPLSEASYRGLVWGTEALWNQEDRPLGGAAAPASAAASLARTLAPGLLAPLAGPLAPAPLAVAPASAPAGFRQHNAVGLYSYLETRLTRRFSPGFLFEWAQDVDGLRGDTIAYSPYLTIWASEFQRFRLQYTRLEEPGSHDNQFFLQWTVILGSHVHTFRDR